MTNREQTAIRLLDTLLRDAKEQKRRVGQRLHALRGTGLTIPSRGARLENGHKCLRWHFWQAARHKHHVLTRKVTLLASLLRKEGLARSNTPTNQS